VDLQWTRGDRKNWFTLDNVDLSRATGFGVYVIWRQSVTKPLVMYVGRGPIDRELELRRTDPLFRFSTELHVSWALLDRALADRAAAYLYRRLQPLWGRAVPFAFSQRVNCPIKL
jgi:hypothetical protein